MYLRHGFRRPNFVPKFGASVRSSAPTENLINHPSQRRTAERLRRGHEEQARIGAEAIKKGQSSATATAALSEAESAGIAAGQIQSLPDK